MYEVSVIIPNFNGKKYLKDCLDALLMQDFPSFEIVVVDNGSEDGSIPYLSRNYPQVRQIALRENTGFCGAVNVGIHSSQAKYILLLNNDTIVQEGFIQALVQDIKKSLDIFRVRQKCCRCMITAG